ncbi:hypothetical protein L4C34_19965 [Vibrio profundum]|uniref:DUF7793 family protein n=1 Tax=Vibrio profundum TaxID=2910247 RepID=UPI003D1057E7
MNKNSHGSFLVEYDYVDENILVFRLVENWNMETAKEFVDESLKIVEDRFSGERWASIVDYRKWGLCTPEVMNYFNGSCTLFSASNLVRHAVIPNNQLQSMVVGQYSHAMKESVITQYFIEENTALAWVRESLKRSQ